ncbi:sulfite exporter TauE/SafE family protein [Inhella gelatinilytica]|uniref:Probable membrane transporter protein n=1 Tax=Inhella gelatinilytica TaxID=2795030 RepID=A0A931NE53_9BURK|nr:sulfite exporter TauE/SafE family protein [Inhella gelatinilytica]MBH9553802.1 sulfite exporter TauE/SafE family protein [Inhella gelatinilytica]
MLGLIALGIGTGFLAGLLGIGGGMVMVPILTVLLDGLGVAADQAVKVAIATSMACISFTSFSSLRAHHRRGAVRWDWVRQLAPAMVIGGWVCGGALFAALKGTWLTGFFACFVGFSALQMWQGPRPSQAADQVPPRGLVWAVGALIGLFSGLVGAGGGFLTVPFLSSMAVPLHQAVATSAATGFPIAVANSLGYLLSGWHLPSPVPGLWGYFYLPALAVLIPCTMVTAPLGARAAHALPVAKLKKLFAGLLVLLATYMGWRAVQLSV